ncbi:MAG: AAA family ATPase, partial [candidate division WOR-3 bacterium]
MVFENLLGSEKVFAQLRRLGAKPSFPPLLFWGRPGIGKRTTALLFARSLICEEGGCGKCRSCQEFNRLGHPDLFLIFPAPPKGNEDEKYQETIQLLRRRYSLYEKRPNLPRNYLIHLEEIHNLSAEMRFPPRRAKRRVVLIIDAERLTQEAANALLKTLEEPQPATRFILLTSRFSLLPATIRSRCLSIYFPPLSDELIARHLLEMGYEEIFVKRALAFAYGSLRRALDFLANPFPIPEEILDLALAPSLPALLTL